MSLRILMVDDDASTRKVMTRILTGDGHVVDACENAAEALALLGAARYDILLTDFVMPAMDGLELTRAAREIAPHLRCVIMSGQQAVEGATDVVWLGKPIDIDELVAVLGA